VSRDTCPKCRICRRENAKLFLKGERCYTEKCAIERRPYAPGQHGQNRSKSSEYGNQLREKQKVRRSYGVSERQFRNYYAKAAVKKGITGDTLLQSLERRLDNVVYRLGFADSRCEARQLVRHAHITVNNRKVDIPSYLVNTGDVVSVKEKSRAKVVVTRSLGNIDKRGVPAWMELDKAKFAGTVKAMPAREDVSQQFQERMIVELYSK
jgi:small subunit ribosomal protein S4